MKTIILIISICLSSFSSKIFAQDLFFILGENSHTFLGFQTSYSNGINSANNIGLGLNIYRYSPEKLNLIYGLHAAPIMVLSHRGEKAYFGQRIGMNFHIMPFLDNGSPTNTELFAIRISPAVEHHGQGNWLVGGDMGISLLGVYPFYSFYTPIGNNRIKSNAYRIGIRFVINGAFFKQLR
jgi:hypothetical protein